MRAIKVIDLKKIKESLSFKYDKTEINEQTKACKNGFIKEYENMKICSKNNNNSVKCYEYFNNDDNFTIIMELCDKNLSQLLNEKISKSPPFNLEEILEIMKQLNNTFKIMEGNNIIHRDLKLENILIKYNDKEKKLFTIKLTDYGCSKRLQSLSNNYVNTQNMGTVKYMAPEILKGENYDYKVDLWSIGIIILRLNFGNFPFPVEKEEALIDFINRYGNKLIKNTGNEELDDLIKRLLEKEPSKRLNWEEYFNHSFFNKYKNKINLIYEKNNSNFKYANNIFGEKFIDNNKNNIELIINGKKTYLKNNFHWKHSNFVMVLNLIMMNIH